MTKRRASQNTSLLLGGQLEEAWVSNSKGCRISCHCQHGSSATLCLKLALKKDFVDVFSDFTVEPMLLAKSARAADLVESIFNSYKQKLLNSSGDKLLNSAAAPGNLSWIIFSPSMQGVGMRPRI